MKTFPMFLKVQDRKIIVVGGGEQAAQKARLALKTEADLVLVAPTLDMELSELIAEGRARQVPGYVDELFDNAALTFIATGCKGADAAWHAIAKGAGALVNVVDYPELCDAITPSIVDRDPVVVAIGTEGTAPVLGRRVKTRIEEMLHPRLGAFAALAGRLRGEVARRVAPRDRRAFWRWVFGDAPWAIFAAGNEREAASMLKTAIHNTSFGERIGQLGILSGAVAQDLVPFGMVARLQEADTIFVEAGVPENVVELARRDAARLRIPDGAAFKQMLPDIVETAARPERVVCLMAGQLTSGIPTIPGVEIEHFQCAQQVSVAETPRRSARLQVVASGQQ